MREEPEVALVEGVHVATGMAVRQDDDGGVGQTEAQVHTVRDDRSRRDHILGAESL